jgi:hypothetical protein
MEAKEQLWEQREEWRFCFNTTLPDENASDLLT